MCEFPSSIDIRTRSAGVSESFDRRAQSETVGVVLLTVVIVILVTGIGVVYLGGTGDQAGGNPPLFDAEVNATTVDFSIIHVGGESIPLGELDVIVQSDEDRARFDMDRANVTGTDDRFDPSERFERHHGFGGGRMEVLVVHTDSNALLHREYLDVAEGDVTRTHFAYAPSDPEPGTTVSFDASTSVGLGEIRTYAWDWDGDGRYEVNRSTARVDHTFATNGQHEVTLTVVDARGRHDSTTRDITVASGSLSIERATLTDGDDDLVTSGDEVTVATTVEPGTDAVDGVTVDAGAFAAGTISLTDEDDDGTYERSFDVGSDPVDGSCSVTVTVDGASGVRTTAETNEVTVDTTAPVVDVSVSDESSLPVWYGFYTEEYRIQWNVTDATTDVTTSTVFVNRTDEIQATYDPVAGERTYSNRRGLFVYSGREHDIKVVAVDMVGNRACTRIVDVADGDDPPQSAVESC